jgi:hypothetical protein
VGWVALLGWLVRYDEQSEEYEGTKTLISHLERNEEGGGGIIMNQARAILLFFSSSSGHRQRRRRCRDWIRVAGYKMDKNKQLG